MILSRFKTFLFLLFLHDVTIDVLINCNKICDGDSLQNPKDEHDLHVVIDSKQGQVIADDNGNGEQMVTLDGRASHTHEPGQNIVYFEWTDESGNMIAEGEEQDFASALVAVGQHSWTLKIFDGQGKSLSGCFSFVVAEKGTFPGAVIKWYPGLKSLSFDANQQKAQFAQFSNFLNVKPPFPVKNNVIVEMKASTNALFGEYSFDISGGADSEIFIGGEPQLSDVFDGVVDISIRIQVDNPDDLPINVKLMGPKGQVTEFFHNQEEEPPIISSLSEDQGSQQGGNSIKIFGRFISPNNVKVLVGDVAVPNKNIEQATSQSVVFQLPPGEPGQTTIQISSNGKTSNVVDYEYKATPKFVQEKKNDEDATGGVPGGIPPSGGKKFSYASGTNNPKFTQKQIKLPKKPTSMAWCHGKLYTSSAYENTIQQVSFNEDFQTVSVKQFDMPIDGKESILGIGCNPQEKGGNWKLYFTHTRLYYQKKLTKFQPYFGQVSYTVAPGFKGKTTIVTNLPTSNLDHGVNQLQFDNAGNMYIGVGGNTNSGIPHPKMGMLHESPYSGAIVKVSGGGGDISCQFRDTAPAAVLNNEDPMDARYGHYVDCSAVGVSVYASGLRNPFGVLYSSKGELYASDNGPNKGYGACLEFDCDDGEYVPDRIIQVDAGKWYGHPNPNRGENTYIPSYKPGTGGAAAAKILLKAGGTTGMCEYTSQTFRGAWKGHFFVERFKATQFRCNPSFSKCVEDDDENSRPNSPGTDCVVLPGGVVAIAQYPDSTIALNVPEDKDAKAGISLCFDVTPWRGTQGAIFHIGCANLKKCTGVEVFFCSTKAELTSVGEKWIEGITPSASGKCSVQVVCGGVLLPKINSFLYV